MYEFAYHKPGSLADATAALNSAADGKLMAGGQTLIPTLKQRLAQPSDVIDLGGIGELSGISVSGDAVKIGATTRHAAVAASGEVASAIPALAKLAGGIGDPQVRNMGTIGGSIANNDPAADYPAALVALGATVVTSKRSLSAEDFFVGMFDTALDEDEIVVSVTFPLIEKGAYAKYPNPASRYAMAGVYVAKHQDGSVRVAVTGAGHYGVFRVDGMEAALAANWSPDAVAGIKVDAGSMLHDLHGSAAYRANLVTVMAKRAVEKAG